MFAAKVPQVITHEKILVDCDAEFKEFVSARDSEFPAFRESGAVIGNVLGCNRHERNSGPHEIKMEAVQVGRPRLCPG